MCWFTLQTSDVSENTKFSAVHISYINPKCYIFKEMIFLANIYFNSHISLCVMISACKLWPFSPSHLIAYCSYTQSSSYFSSNIPSTFSRSFPDLHFKFYVRVLQLLSSVVLLPVSSFLSSVSSFMFDHFEEP